MSLILPVTAGTLASGFCPSDYQDMLNGFSAKQSVVFPESFTGITTSSTKPTDTSKAWLQLDTLGRPLRLYYFAQGAWLSQHPQITGETIIWTAALPDFTTFDGGSAGVVSAISGPMWEEVTALRARFPLGAGTSTLGTVYTQGASSGEEKNTLDITNVPSHTHTVDGLVNTSTGGGFQTIAVAKIVSPDPESPTKQTQATGGDATAPHATVAHNNMPLYYVVHFLRRTNRLFYTVT